MSERGRSGVSWGLLGATLLLALGCGASEARADEDRWKAEWNARVDGHTRLRDHPCGDFAFDPWADAFLGGCGAPEQAAGSECGARTDWVNDRARQCRVWKNWLLRNHNRRERRDDVPEPPTRVR